MSPDLYYKVTPKILEYADIIDKKDKIDPKLYSDYGVYRGLRNLDGEGLNVGISGISEVCAKKTDNGCKLPDEGRLFYRGYDIKDIAKAVPQSSYFGYEECIYLLIFGELPNSKELDDFKEFIAGYRSLPDSFVRDIIMKAPSRDMMNTLARSVLTLYSYDDNADDISTPNVLRQCISLISVLPMLAVYGYHAYNHFYNGKTLYIHNPDPKLSTAENILSMLRPDRKYTHTEAKILDLMLILHMEHGGGANSTYTTRLTTTSGTDTYSVIAAALGSLKGPQHGGQTLLVMKMIEDLMENVSDWTSRDEVSSYLEDLLDQKAFDKSGKIYGMGHAIYSLSDPRAVILKHFVEIISKETGREKEYDLICMIEELAPEIIAKKRKIYKGVCVNVEFFCGFVYRLLKIPEELYTPIFAIARIAGWSAHRLEEICTGTRIIRPSFYGITPRRSFIPMDQR